MTSTSILAPGLKNAWSNRVGESLTARTISQALVGFSDIPPVFARAFMIGLIEWTCIEAVRALVQPGERAVGTHVDMRSAEHSSHENLPRLRFLA